MDFRPPEAIELGALSALAALAPALAVTVASVAGDVALVVDDTGVVRHIAVNEADLGAWADGWIGRHWADTATGDTRRKVEGLLDEVRGAGRSRRREVNHPSGAGFDIPVAWAAIRLGDGGPVLAVGRDLRAAVAVQQRYLDSQQQLERDHWRRREAEAPYRLLFQVATDAVLLLDAHTHQVLEANQAAIRLFGAATAVLAGLSPAAWAALEQPLALARDTCRAGQTRLRLQPEGPLLEVSVTPFRAEHSFLLLLRVHESGHSEAQRMLAAYVEQAPEAVVVCDRAGRVLAGNPAFAALVHESLLAPLEGQPLAALMSHAVDEVDALLADAHQHGMAVRTLPVSPGEPPVEASAMWMPGCDQECIGIRLRPTHPRHPMALGPAVDLARAVGHLAEQVGQRPLPQLMRQATALAERHLIESALQRHGTDRDATATALGLTPESLDLRMRRLGLLPGQEARPTPV